MLKVEGKGGSLFVAKIIDVLSLVWDSGKKGEIIVCAEDGVVPSWRYWFLACWLVTVSTLPHIIVSKE